MRATLTTAALTLTALLCAGCGLAVEAVDDAMQTVQGTGDEALEVATGLSGDVSGKAQMVTSVIVAITANFAGQASAAATLAVNLAAMALTAVHMELEAAEGAAHAALACSAAAGAPLEAQACLAAAAEGVIAA